jgi:hypothetical protein
MNVIVNKNPHRNNLAGNCYEQATDRNRSNKINNIFLNKQVLVNLVFKFF